MTSCGVRHRLKLSQTPTGRMVPQGIAMDVDVVSHALVCQMSVSDQQIDLRRRTAPLA